MDEISPIKKIDLNAIRAKPGRDPLLTKVLSLEVGQGFEVKGRDREGLNNLKAVARKEGKRIATKKLGQLNFLIFRYA